MSELFDRPIFETPIVVIDTETTGLYPAIGHRIVELAAVRLDPDPSGSWRVSQEFSQLINPGRSMDPEASRINGIYDSDLAGKPTFEDISSNITALLDGAVLVAHNAPFDASFLGMEIYIENLYSPDKIRREITNPWLCTLRLARRNFHFGGNSLGHIARMLQVRTGRAHRALADVYTTYEVLKRMIHSISSWSSTLTGDLLYLQGGPIYTPDLPEVILPHPLNTAIDVGARLKIDYAGPKGRAVYTVNPHYATEQDGKQYLITYCDELRDQRTFRVDRIKSAELV